MRIRYKFHIILSSFSFENENSTWLLNPFFSVAEIAIAISVINLKLMIRSLHFLETNK